MAKNYAKRDFKKRSPAKAQRNFGWLWLVTGILIGGFGFGLLFLKKNVTIIEAPPAPAAPTPATTHPAHPKTAPESRTSSDDKTNYDFYTMLPNSQVQVPATVSDSSTDTPPPPAKANKPLAEAEQSLLGQTRTPTPTPVASVKATAEPKDLNDLSGVKEDSKVIAVKKALDDGVRYNIDSGSFDSYEAADAHKAELTMAGFDHVRIESTMQGDTAAHRVVVGPYKNKAEALSVQKNLQSEHFSAQLIASP